MIGEPQHSAPKYDLFVSYSPADREWVEGYLLDALDAANVRVISELNFALGAPRLGEFERALNNSKRTLLVISPAYMAESALQFVNVMVQHYGLESGTWPVIPLVLEAVELPPRLGFLVSLDATNPEDWADIVARLCSTLKTGPPPPAARPPCPYPGMRAYREQEATYFHGREAEVEELVQRLRRHPFVAIIGPSGSGKSSLVSAGLIPALRRSSLFGSGKWVVRTMRPGAQPVATLATALDTDDLQNFTPAVLLAAEPEASHLLLVIDQLEEVFTQGSTQKEDFFAVIQRYISLQNCYAVITVRADFFDDLLTSTLWSLVQQHRLEITPLNAHGLRSAIVKPAEDVGVFIESALVERLVASSAGQPGLLPFVQEVMVRLWEKLERRYLPLRAYEALVLPLARYSGNERTGIQAAMAQLADEIIHNLSPAQQRIAQRILLRLVQFGEGRDDTRRQQPVSALIATGDDPALFDRTLNYLAENRLVVLSSDEDGVSRVDLAHEAMLTGWPQLAEWIAREKTNELMRRRYEEQAQEWSAHGRGKRGLLSGEDFDGLQRWAESPAGRDAGLTTILLAWVSACKREVKAQRLRALLMRAAITAAAFVIFMVVLVAGGKLDPVVTGWKVAGALPTSVRVGRDGQADLRIRLTPGRADQAFLLDIGHSELFQSEDGGQSWTPLEADPGLGSSVDLAVSQGALCILYSSKIACRRFAEKTWTVTPLPGIGAGVSATALAVDPLNHDRIAVGYSNGRIDLRDGLGQGWRIVTEGDNTSSIGRLGFSGGFLIGLFGAQPQTALTVDIKTGQRTWLEPEPAWPAPANDLSVPSTLGRFLIAAGAAGIVDAEVGTTEWFLYRDPPPGAVWSLTAWADDIYAIDEHQVYCNRYWTWRQLDWWHHHLGMDTPCRA